MWHLRIWFIGEDGTAGLTVGLNDLNDSMVLCQIGL